MNTLEYTIDEARRIGNRLGVDWDKIDIQDFLMGLNTERREGLEKNIMTITHANDLDTGRLVWARLQAWPAYYRPDAEANLPSQARPLGHYYGDRVRQLFLAAAAVVLIGLPFVRDRLALPVFVAVASVLILDFLAAFTSPGQKRVIWANTIISTIAVAIFETFALQAFATNSPYFFVSNQVLAVIFLVTLYFNTKTLRAMLIR